jgi:hypothetical protein
MHHEQPMEHLSRSVYFPHLAGLNIPSIDINFTQFFMNSLKITVTYFLFLVPASFFP